MEKEFMRSNFFQPAALLASLALSGCLWAQNAISANDNTRSGPPEATPTRSTADKPHDDSFIIGNGDVLAINVWKEADISRSVPVRSDGKISLPLVGEVEATGTTPLKLEQAISAKLSGDISQPEVTVMVEQINSEKFNILGQVYKPGAYSLTTGATVLDALALAGGFRDFAKRKAIYVLRQKPDGAQARIAFNYKEVVTGRHPEQNIPLQPHDTVVVP